MPHPQHIYLGRVEFDRALRAQDAVCAGLRAGGKVGRVLGFESEPVVTLGLRATAADAALSQLPVVKVDRGGQATIHNPGQLVIFPVWPLGGLGSRAWVDLLVGTTRRVAAELGQPLLWREDQPGLYDPGGGKVASIGLRVRRGISTHGLSINLSNDLSVFGLIRTCGTAAAPLAHLKTSLSARAVFARWADEFLGQFT